MRISDWSSDVCSSDLVSQFLDRPTVAPVLAPHKCAHHLVQDERVFAAKLGANLNIQISPLVPAHLRNEFGRQRPPEATPAPRYVEVLDQATDHCVATRLISNEWEYHILLVQSLHQSAELAIAGLQMKPYVAPQILGTCDEKRGAGRSTVLPCHTHFGIVEKAREHLTCLHPKTMTCVQKWE